MDEPLKVGLISLIIIAAFGIFPSLFLGCWDWFGRSGAVLVVSGLTLTWYNFNHDAKLEKTVGQVHDTIWENVAENDINRHVGVMNDFSQLFNSRRKVIELIIICIGTLIWGYGDLVGRLFS